MSGPAHITNPPVALGGDRPAGYDPARDVKVRTAAGRRSDPPAADVPRGFYLNIQV